MLDGDTAASVQRITVALESIAASLLRIANYVDPSGPPRERKPAILTSAKYPRKEQESDGWTDEAAKKSQERDSAPSGPVTGAS